MTEPRRFNARPEASEPKAFVLEYTHLQRDDDGRIVGREDAEQSFTCAAVAPPSAILAFTEKVEDRTGRRPASALIGFLGSVLVPEDVARWDELMASQDDEVDVQVLGAITEWLMAEYNGRPTRPS